MYNILILDDEYSIRSVLELTLKKNGFKVGSIESVDRALELEDTSLAPISTADLIISDFEMFDKTAMDLLKYLDEHNLNIPVIIHSGYINAEKEIKNSKYKNLVLHFISKPATKNDILTAINCSLEVHNDI